MSRPKGKTLKDYLRTIESTKDEKPDQVRDGIEIYVGMWRKAMEKGIVKLTDEMGDALKKIDDAGGLQEASED